MIDSRMAPWGALVLRVALGLLLLAHGLMKLLMFTPAGTARFFQSLGLPGWFGELVMAGEIIGGLMLVLGVYARYVALLFMFELIGTIVLVHGANGFFGSAKGEGWQYPAFWAVTLFVQFLIGDGALALVRSPDFERRLMHAI